MTENKNKYDTLLGLFVSNDELRPKMMKPCKRGEYVYATDAYSIAKIPSSIPSNDYTQDHDFYDVERLFELESNCNVLIDFAPIEEWFNSVPMITEHDDCKECGGDGEIYCYHCRNTNECSECGGTGIGIGKKIGERPDFNFQYILDGIAFSYRNLYRLFLAKNVENKDVVWLLKTDYGANVFHIGDIQIVLMPMLHDKQNKQDDATN